MLGPCYHIQAKLTTYKSAEMPDEIAKIDLMP